MANISTISEFILTHSRKATLERINALKPGVAKGHLRIDGYANPIDLHVELTIEKDRLLSDWAGTSGLDKKGINVPLVYTKAYACYALKCAIAPDIPNNAASLAPFEISAPENSIVNALPPAPVALRHVIGHMVPDTVYNALDKLLPGVVPAEGAGCLCNFQVSLRPRTDAPAPKDAVRSEVLTFNSGGSGARPTLDGMSATAFPSGVMTMPVEATEQVGPVIIWRKELRPDSGVGRHGGEAGAATTIVRSDGAAMQGKGKQFIPHGQTVCMAFPGGAGYGSANDRDIESVKGDVALGYISAEHATNHYNLSAATVADVLSQSKLGEIF